MKKFLSGVGGALCILACAANAHAQVAGLPVYGGGVSTGIDLAADVGFSNDAAGGGMGYGARASIGIGFIGATAMISRYSPDGGDGFVSPGVAGSLRLFGGPLIPIRVVLQAGVARWDVNDVKTTRAPVSLAIGATIPNPAFAIRPWIAPRIDFTRSEFGGDTETSSDFAISGGIELGLITGFTIRAAYDRTSRGDGTPAVFSIGVGFSP